MHSLARRACMALLAIDTREGPPPLTPRQGAASSSPAMLSPFLFGLAGTDRGRESLAGKDVQFRDDYIRQRQPTLSHASSSIVSIQADVFFGHVRGPEANRGVPLAEVELNLGFMPCS